MSPQTARRLKNFDDWVKKLFNSGLISRQVVYSTLPFIDREKNITINNGRMILEMPSDAHPYRIYDVSSGSKDLIGTSESLPQVLLMGLHRAIDNRFVATYRE